MEGRARAVGWWCAGRPATTNYKKPSRARTIDGGAVSSISVFERVRSGAWAPVVLLVGLAGVLVIAFLSEFAIAPARGATGPRRVAQRLFPLLMACSGVIVLLGA